MSSPSPSNDEPRPFGVVSPNDPEVILKKIYKMSCGEGPSPGEVMDALFSLQALPDEILKHGAIALPTPLLCPIFLSSLIGIAVTTIQATSVLDMTGAKDSEGNPINKEEVLDSLSENVRALTNLLLSGIQIALSKDVEEKVSSLGLTGLFKHLSPAQKSVLDHQATYLRLTSLTKDIREVIVGVSRALSDPSLATEARETLSAHHAQKKTPKKD